MKIRKIFIIGIAAALILAIGVLIFFITIKNHSNIPDPKTIAAAPVPQDASQNQTPGPGNSNLNVKPSSGVNVVLPGIFSNEKSVLDAKDLIDSITEGDIGSGNHYSLPSDQSKGYFYRSFVIKFKQNMDAGTLNSQNILGFIDKDSTEINSSYNAELRELQIDIKLDSGQVAGNTAAIYVLLTKNIKTADDKFIDNDYVYSIANNK
jgi:hypothetical protein